jgi:hypothetical protein
MVLLGDKAQVEARFSMFGIVVTLRKIGAQFAPSILEARILFWTHRMELLGDMGHVESRFGLFGESVSVSVR